jgi:hypothetical protein
MDGDGFGMFGARMLNASEFQFQLRGEVNVSMLYGMLQIQGLRLEKEVQMEGNYLIYFCSSFPFKECVDCNKSKWVKSP